MLLTIVEELNVCVLEFEYIMRLYLKHNSSTIGVL